MTRWRLAGGLVGAWAEHNAWVGGAALPAPVDSAEAATGAGTGDTAVLIGDSGSSSEALAWVLDTDADVW